MQENRPQGRKYTTTFKPLTSEVNNVDYVVIEMRCTHSMFWLNFSGTVL